MAYKFTTGSVERGDLYNEDDVDQNTYIDWGEDSIIFYAGGRGFIKLEEEDQDKVIINHGAVDIDLKVGGETNANLIRTIASEDRVGIATGTPSGLFHISGSDGVLLQIDATSGSVPGANAPILCVTGGAIGRVGIGTDSPSTTLHAYADASSTYVATVDNDASSNAHGLKVTTDGNGSGTNVLD